MRQFICGQSSTAGSWGAGGDSSNPGRGRTSVSSSAIAIESAMAKGNSSSRFDAALVRGSTEVCAGLQTCVDPAGFWSAAVGEQ